MSGVWYMFLTPDNRNIFYVRQFYASYILKPDTMQFVKKVWKVFY